MATEPDEAPWLSRQEQHAWLSLNGVAMLLPYALEADLQRDHGLALFEYGVLSILSESPGRSLRMKSLAGMTGGSLSRLSHVVTRLEKRGLVRREPLPQDGRTTVAVLTDDGWAAIVAAAPDHVRSVRSLVLDGLDPAEVEALGRLCRVILDRVLPRCEVPQDLTRRLDAVSCSLTEPDEPANGCGLPG